MDPNNPYAILGRQAGDGSLVHATDAEIKRINDDYLASLCPFCHGGGVIYEEPAIKGDSWPKHTCVECGGTGRR